MDAAALRAKIERERAAERQGAVDRKAQIGRSLIEAKGRELHGKWGPWLDRRFPWSKATATRFMTIDRNLGADARRFAALPLAALYLVASRSTSPEARAAVLRRIEVGGERITHAEVTRIVGEARAKRIVAALFALGSRLDRDKGALIAALSKNNGALRALGRLDVAVRRGRS